MELNTFWEQQIKDGGADFVAFVDTAALPGEVPRAYACAVLFGKALSRDYITTLRAEQAPKRKEAGLFEAKMENLAIKVAGQLEAAGYQSVAKIKSPLLPHKTVALRAGLGFIGKNNLLVHHQYGCALVLGKVLTTAPFAAGHSPLRQPECGPCTACVDICPTGALRGTAWNETVSRDDMMVRKLCTRCLKCMVWCPYTGRYAG